MNLIDPKQGGKAALAQQPRPVRHGLPVAENDNRRPQPPRAPEPASPFKGTRA